MAQVKKNVNDIFCDEEKRNQIEIDNLHKFFKSKNPIPSPVINKENEVIAFHNSFFLLKELGFEDLLFVEK